MRINILKGENAITLIALIVTIIVLLILAMTSVSLVLRENLIEKAKIAKNKYELAAQNETESLDVFESELNEYFVNNDDETIEELLTQFIDIVTQETPDMEQAKSIKTKLQAKGFDENYISVSIIDETYVYFYNSEITFAATQMSIIKPSEEEKNILEEMLLYANYFNERKEEINYGDKTIRIGEKDYRVFIGESAGFFPIYNYENAQRSNYYLNTNRDNDTGEMRVISNIFSEFGV